MSPLADSSDALLDAFGEKYGEIEENLLYHGVGCKGAKGLFPY